MQGPLAVKNCHGARGVVAKLASRPQLTHLDSMDLNAVKCIGVQFGATPAMPSLKTITVMQGPLAV
jgi:hypothetical protein